jgi:sugar lactone lactonase YvrE
MKRQIGEGRTVRRSGVAFLFALLIIALLVPVALAAPKTARQLVKGALIDGANGLTFSADNKLIVASVFGRELVVTQPVGRRILARYGPEIGVDGCDDVAVHPDGSIYWTDILGGNVGRIAPDGTVTVQAIAPGMNPITITDDGRVFAGQAFFGDGLYELDPALVGPPRVIIPDSTIPPFAAQLNGFDIGPDGYLYAPRPFMGEIVRVDLATGDITVLADGLLDLGPTALDFDSQGRPHVSFGYTGEIARFDMSTWTYEVIATVPAGLDNMAFDKWGRLYVSNGDEGSVVRIGRSGRASTVKRPGLIAPGGLAIVTDGKPRHTIYVADLWRLKSFDSRSGRLIKSYPAVMGMIGAKTVAVAGDYLVLSSWMDGAVQLWDPATETVVDTFPYPSPLNAIAFKGDLIVADIGLGAVVRQDGVTGVQEVLAGAPDLAVPAGLAATDTDLWVGDWATGIIWHLVAGGVPLSPPVPVVTGLIMPEGMAVDNNGDLLVVETGTQRLLRVDPLTGATETAIEQLRLELDGHPNFVPTWNFNGVAVGSNGRIYVTEDAINSVSAIWGGRQ